MERAELTVVCGWCGELIRLGGERISHGICVSCAMDFMSRLPRTFLETIADPDGTVTLFSGQKLPIDGPNRTDSRQVREGLPGSSQEAGGRSAGNLSVDPAPKP